MSAADLIQSLVHRTAQLLPAKQPLPGATYRLQFNRLFQFRDAALLVPYLSELGITDCYASPYLKARPGSTHGYDISDHAALNPEIGSEEDYHDWIEALHRHGMGQIFDMVPNHMGIVGGGNAWWNDILENGPSSPYAGYFDIDWYSSLKQELHHKVLLPILGDPYGKVLESRQLVLHYDAGAFSIGYFEHRFPLEPGSYAKVLNHRLEDLEQQLGATSEAFVEYQSILTALGHLPPFTSTDPQKAVERQREKEVIKRRLATLTAADAVRTFIERNIANFNGGNGDPRSFDLLDELLNGQAYRLCFWRVASDEINYRRFFDINELAALSMEKAEVFAATHTFILRLASEGKINGLRIDHVDGLFDPRHYLERLQEYYFLELARRLAETEPEFKQLNWPETKAQVLEALRAPENAALARGLLYVVIEKILGRDEPIPEDWPIHGTTGYEYLNWLNGLFVASESAGAFTRIYQRFSRNRSALVDIVHDKKFLIMQVALSSELHMLAHQLNQLSEKNRWSRDFTLNSLRHALREVISSFPVYRSYIRCGDEVLERDRRYVERAVALARRRNPVLSPSLFDFVQNMILLQYQEGTSEEVQNEQCRFVGKFQQVTSPVMAKGMEDTSYYVYNRLLSLNEVGGDPNQFGVSADDFHRHNHERRQKWPHALSATATHDTKRGEDARARINVLSEMPQEWRKRLSRWGRLNRRHLVRREGVSAPDRNDEYLFYQSLVGSWPLEPDSDDAFAEFTQRMLAYMQKATHEAKVHTSWINPDPAYDKAVHRFVSRALDENLNNLFLEDLREFQRTVSHLGIFNSLSQTLLKIASPGVPDFYQGTELWDFSLVDPDNRRPVDYELRRRLLDDIRRLDDDGITLAEAARRMVDSKEDGRIKLYLIWRALRFRRGHAKLFAEGDYVPLTATGTQAKHVVAFARGHEGECVLICVPRLVAQLLGQQQRLPLGAEVWSDTLLPHPTGNASKQYRNLFTGEIVPVIESDSGPAVRLADAFANFPVAMLIAGPS